MTPDTSASTVLERAPVAAAVPAARPGPTGTGRPVGGKATTRSVAGATLTTALAILLRSGYRFGLFDQTVYSVRGIALADPAVFARDWFARSVPQPHWLFDAITYVGARFGILPAAYLAYWLAGIVAFAVASVWLVERFLPGRGAFALALGPLVAMGPTNVLGSTTPLLWFADPHMLGGCLAVLALAAVLTGRWRWAVVAALAAETVHVQHGANLAPVLLLAAVLARDTSRRNRVLLAGTAGVLTVGAPLIAQWRGLQTGGDEWLTTCRDIIPFHCYAPSWPAGYLASGAVVLALAFGLAWWGRRHWRSTVPAVVLPAAGLLVGLVGERFQLGPLGRLAEQYNVHRLVTLVEPMAALAVLVLVARVTTAGPRRREAALLALAFLAVWVTIFDGAAHGSWTAGSAAALALTGALLALLAWFPAGRIVRDRPGAGVRRPVAALVAVAVGMALGGARTGTLGHLGYDRSLVSVQIGEALQRLLPADAVIAAAPSVVWLRALSRRSVIADCKAVPYGGPPWHEWMSRMEALGGFCRDGQSHFADVSPAAVEALVARYGATHVLLFDDDPKIDYARAHWTEVYAMPAPAPGDPTVRGGIAVFALPPA